MPNFELFRFVDVHSPDYLKRDNNPFITSFDELILAGGSSSLVDDIKSALDPTNETPIEDINTIVTAFIGGSTYINSEDGVNTATNNTLNALKKIQVLEPFEKNEVKSVLESEISPTILDDITSTTIRDIRLKIWDNLIVEIIKPSNIILKDALINSLRVYRLIEIIKLDESVEADLKKALNGFPMLPKGIFKLPYKQDTPETPPPSGDPTVEEINIELKAKFDLLSNVYIEIKNQHEELIRVYTGTPTTFVPEFDSEGNLTNPEEIPLSPDCNNFTDARKDLLSEDVTEVVDDLNLNNEIGRTYDITLQKIIKAKTDIFEQLFKTAKKYEKAIYSDGFLINVEDITVGDPGDTDPVEPWPGGLTTQPVQFCTIKPVGVGDYRKVEQSWEKYIPGEIAHIENVMQTELRDRETRHLRRQEETLTVETIKEEEVLRDLQTTERFALLNETSKIIKNELEVDLAANISGKVLLSNFSVSTGMSYGYSSQTSQFNSINYAKEVIEKASKRVTERIREERVIKVLEEYEEKNKRTFDNIDGTGHVVGIYRWLDLVYKCKLVNYGIRLSFEFSIPEPAAFHIHAKSSNPADSIVLEKPIHPRDGVNIPGLGIQSLQSAEDLNSVNFLAWASAYDANVDPYPTVKSISNGYAKTTSGYSAETYSGLIVPDGYNAISGVLTCSPKSGSGLWVTIKTNIGGQYFTFDSSYNLLVSDLVIVEGPIAVSAIGSTQFFANVAIFCLPKDETIQKWKIDTYKAILEAYNRKKMEYDDALQQIQVQQEYQLRSSNPALYRQIEKKELKRGCIQLLNSGYYNLFTGYNNFFDQFNAMKYKDDNGYPLNPNEYPEFDNCKAIAEGHVVSFFEKVFDWDIMSYKFYPYFWGQKKRWKMLYNLEENDPLFSNFLQSGHAKVIIPVKPGYETAAIQFLETGQIWNGGLIAGADPDNASALNMIDDFYGLPNNGEPIEEHEWETRVPTNLVILQEPGVNITDGPGLPENTTN